MTGVVKLFLAWHWVVPLDPRSGLKQHVASLYSEVFRYDDVRVYPKSAARGLAIDSLRHLWPMLTGGTCVLAQGYPVIAGALVSFVRRKTDYIVHTWKVPGVTHDRITARVNDMFLQRVIDRARAVVVVSLAQKRQLEERGVSCPVIFAPVSVDCQFWRPDDVGIGEVLSRFALARQSYVLTVGGPDRDELYGAKLAKTLGLTYVRATYDLRVAERAKGELERERLAEGSRVLLNPSYPELRALYAGAWLLCLQTDFSVKASGLTSLVEAMACGAPVAVPAGLAEGYVEDRVNGLVIRGNPETFATTLDSVRLREVRRAARQYAQRMFDHAVVARKVRAQLQSARPLAHGRRDNT